MEKKYIDARAIRRGDGTLELAVFSDDSLDRTGEVIDPSGWELENYKRNPVLLWSHDSGWGESRPAIGEVKNLRVENGRLVGTPVFDLDDPFAKLVHDKFQKGILRAFSVGFLPLEKDGQVYKKQELLEISAVNVPANQNALVQVRSLAKSLEGDKKKEAEAIADLMERFLAKYEERGAVRFEETPTASKERAWDADAAVARLRRWAGGPDKESIDWDKYRRGFAWYDAEDRENFGSYKLPHHDVIDGQLKVVWRGVVAAAQVLQGGRGGVDIPEGDVDAVKRHIARHYRQFDETAPWERSVDARQEVEEDPLIEQLKSIAAKFEDSLLQLQATISRFDRKVNELDERRVKPGVSRDIYSELENLSDAVKIGIKAFEIFQKKYKFVKNMQEGGD